MPTVELTFQATGNFHNVGFTSVAYAPVQEDAESSSANNNSQNISVGQRYQGSPWLKYTVDRSAVRFSLADIPLAADITAATLKLYGYSVDFSADDFDVTVAGGDFSDPAINSDFDQGLSVSFGTINTSVVSTSAYNSITINATGLAYLNDALSTGLVELYLRSNLDIAATAPPAAEYYWFRGGGAAAGQIPILEITYSVFGEDLYPTAPVFPATGRIDLATYSVTRSYLTGIDDDLLLITDGDGNINLAVANWITWNGTSEKIAYDNGTSHVTVTTLEATSSITIVADLVTADPSITTTGTAVDSTVANDALLSNTAHASIKAKITDNEIGFDAIPSSAPADDEADIYLEIATGDLLIKTRDDGQAGVKTDKLGDFSAM